MNIPGEMPVSSMARASALVGAAVATENIKKSMLKSMVDSEIVVFMIAWSVVNWYVSRLWGLNVH